MFVSCGLNYKTAPIALREKCYFTSSQLPSTLKKLTSIPGIREAVILSTCNRTEVYCETENSPQVLSNWFVNHYSLQASNISDYLYFHQQEETVSHIMRVACGLDSMILGETQIVGQLKEAVSIADTTGVLGKHLRKLFQHVFSVSKQVRTDTKIGKNSISLGHIAILLAKRIFSDLSQCRVLLIGAGEIIQLVSRYLQEYQIQKFTVANRTLSHAYSLSEKLNANVIQLENIGEVLSSADIVITATHATFPIIGKGMVERALRQRKHKPVLMIDLSVPRNIEPEVKELEDVYWYCIDSLQTILDENRNKRKDAVEFAKTIIESQTHHFIATLQASKADMTIKAYRQKIKAIRDEMVIKSLQEISMGDHPNEVIEKLADRLINKIMHDPCANLRNASYQGDSHLIETANKLFTLGE